MSKGECVCKHEPCCKDDTNPLVALLMSRSRPADLLAQIEKCRKSGTCFERVWKFLGTLFEEVPRSPGRFQTVVKKFSHS